MNNEHKVNLINTMIDLMNNPDHRVSSEELVEMGLSDEVIVDIVVESLEWYKQYLSVEDAHISENNNDVE